MKRLMISMLLTSALSLGGMGAVALAQTTNPTTPHQAMPSTPTTQMPDKASQMNKSGQMNRSGQMDESRKMSTRTGSSEALTYPICDRTHTDECLQLGQNREMDREIDQQYPKCAKMGGAQKAACVNTAMAK